MKTASALTYLVALSDVVGRRRGNVEKREEAPKLLSCFYGASQCLGLKLRDGLEKATELGCPTSESGETGTATTVEINSLFSANSEYSIKNSAATLYGDGMPCVFHPHFKWDDIKDLLLTDFRVELTDKSLGEVSGATLAPALELNEQQTMLLIGNFGARRGVYPERVTIGGSSYSGADLEYKNNGQLIMWAKWYTEREHFALDSFDACSERFNNITHVIQVAFNGGVTVTYDNNKELPRLPESVLDKDMFQVVLGERVLDKQLLGLADIDGDNYIDLCLKLDEEDVKHITESESPAGLQIRLRSTRDCKFFVPPKADCLNKLNDGPCGDSSVKPQEICVSAIPNATAPCDYAPAREIELAQDEIASLTNCK